MGYIILYSMTYTVQLICAQRQVPFLFKWTYRTIFYSNRFPSPHPYYGLLELERCVYITGNSRCGQKFMSERADLDVLVSDFLNDWPDI